MNETKTTKSVEERAVELRREYHREYRRKNPEKVREWSDRYWKKKATQEMKE